MNGVLLGLLVSSMHFLLDVVGRGAVMPFVLINHDVSGCQMSAIMLAVPTAAIHPFLVRWQSKQMEIFR